MDWSETSNAMELTRSWFAQNSLQIVKLAALATKSVDANNKKVTLH
jgi:hypothetical protein